MPARVLSPRLRVALLILLALIPLCYVFLRTEPARRDVVYWDEFDTALAMLLRLHEQPSAANFGRELFAVNNEHRMVTSRLLFAASYALTGQVNFVALNLIGNATLLGLCGVLLWTARTSARRLVLLLILAALLFQLEHYENFMWSGASIDHFQVVLLAAAAFAGLARNTWGGLALGAAFATLATFTLAHGIVTWPAGAVVLGFARNRRGLAVWCGVAALVILGFLLGFTLNRSQGFATVSLGGLLLVVRYWLTLLGAVPALGGNSAAPFLGAVLLGCFGWLMLTGAPRRERVAFPLALFAIGALALIAIGRAQHSGGVVYSRYYILGAVAWGLTLHLAVVRFSHPRRPLAALPWLVPLLAVFNVAANRAFAADADSWVECRDRAAVRCLQHGVDGRGPLMLHPAPAHSTALLERAARAGIYRLPSVCEPRPFPRKAKESARVAYFVDDMTVNASAVYLTGWAALQGEVSRRHQVKLVLRSAAGTRLFTTVTETRPDVAKATRQPGWELSGFQFAVRREQLPPAEYQVGFLIDGRDGPEFAMTAHRMDLTGDGRALLATGD